MNRPIGWNRSVDLFSLVNIQAQFDPEEGTPLQKVPSKRYPARSKPAYKELRVASGIMKRTHEFRSHLQVAQVMFKFIYETNRVLMGRQTANPIVVVIVTFKKFSLSALTTFTNSPIDGWS